MGIGLTISPKIPEIPITTAADHFFNTINSAKEVADFADSSNILESKNEQTSFSDILMNFLPSEIGNEISEEQLFSAIIAERIEGLKGDDALDNYREFLDKHIETMKQINGYLPIEDASRAALNDMVNQGVLSLEEAESIHAQAFQAAQLDDNKSALYDSLGSTTAVAMIEMALDSSTNTLAAFDSGKKDAGMMSLSYQQENLRDAESASGIRVEQSNTVHIGGGFLFKPVSESDGKLVVLLPSSMSGNVAELIIRDSNGQILDKGFRLDDYDDGRPLFRFPSPGSTYPENISVSAVMNDGEIFDYLITSPDQRHE